MTVPATPRRDGPYSGNGVTTAFAIDFKLFSVNDVEVILTTNGMSSTLVLNSDYSIALNPDQTTTPGGTITYPISGSPMPVGSSLTVIGNLAYLQGQALSGAGRFRPEVVENEFDYLTILIQQLLEITNRGVTLPAAATGVSTELPFPVASALIGWSGDGLSLTNYTGLASAPVSAAMAPVVAAATLALARTALGGTTVGNGVFTASSMQNARIALGIGYMTDVNGFRLTLGSISQPVTTADLTAQGTIFLAPYRSNQIALYTGTQWQVFNPNISYVLSGLVSGRPYDIFCDYNSGTPQLVATAWTNDTTRATSLGYQDGVLVKTGTPTQRYLGTFRTTGVATTEDSAAKRFLWNYYNRVSRKLIRTESTASWTYTTATVRLANGNAANICEMVIGVAEDVIDVSSLAQATNASASTVQNGIGFDSTTAAHADSKGGYSPIAAGSYVQIVCRLTTVPTTPGYHYVSWLETAQPVGTSTFIANVTANAMTNQGGLNGTMMA